MTRYSRQQVLPEIGVAGQEKLRRGAVLCVGAGGLGSPALLYLAAAGIGRIGVIDFDTVDTSNLQRQVLFSEHDVGASKAEAAKKKLLDLNSACDVEVYNHPLDHTNAEKIFSNYDIILDGSDNFGTKFLVNDAAVKLGKPMVYGAIQGFDGQVGVFVGQKSACYRCLHPEKPKATVRNCAEAGVIGPVAGVIGTTQALQAIYLLLKEPTCPPLLGKLWLLNAKTMATQILAVPKNNQCPTCSLPPEDIKLEFNRQSCAEVREIAWADVGKTHTLVDVRTEEEVASGMIPDALHIPLETLQLKANEKLPSDKTMPIVLYCESGVRSAQAALHLNEAGFSDVYSLEGGFAQFRTNPDK